MIDRGRIVELARECLGTPFHHQARVPGVGLDCAGLLVHILDSLDLPYIDERGYGRHPAKGQIKAILDSQPSLRAVENSARATGDVLLMRFRREPQHVAIFAGETIIHSFSTSGGVIEHALSRDWIGGIVKVYRIVAPANVV